MKRSSGKKKLPNPAYFGDPTSASFLKENDFDFQQLKSWYAYSAKDLFRVIFIFTFKEVVYGIPGG